MIILLSILDIVAGISMLGAKYFPRKFLMVVGLLVLIKGLSSIIPQISEGTFLFDWMGWVDVVSGIFLILGLSVSFFWLLPLLKGIYSVVIVKLAG